MTILNLHTGTALLGDLIDSIANLQAGIRVGVREQGGAIYRIDGVTYDSNRMAVVFQIDTTKPIQIGNVQPPPA